MKPALRKLTALLSAAALVSAGMINAGAQNYYGRLDDEKKSESTYIKTVHTNKPYLNITLDKGDIDDSGLYFTLKRDGVPVGTFSPGMNAFSFTTNIIDTEFASSVYDITHVSNDDELIERLEGDGFPREYAFDLQSTSELTNGKTPLSVNPDGDEQSYPIERWERLMIKPNSSCYFGYFDWEKYAVKTDNGDYESMTVPAGSVALNVSGPYSWRGDDSALELFDPSDMDQPIFSRSLNLAADKNFIPVGENGDYMLSLRGKYSFDNRDVSVSERDETYIKLRVPLSVLTAADDDGFIRSTTSGEAYNLDWIWGSNVCSFCFVSGAAISCDKLDTDSKCVEIWVKRSDPYTMMHYTLYNRDTGNIDEAKTGTPLPYELRYDRVDTEMPYPENGITLYNVPEGVYTIETPSDKYDLSGVTTFTVTSTRVLQTMNVTVRTKSTGTTPSNPGGNTPSNPGNTPSNPGNTPSNPGNTPSNPGNTPSNPGNTPSNPGNTPSNPGNTPSNPGNTPSNPGNTPSNPDNTPSNPGTTTPTNPGSTGGNTGSYEPSGSGNTQGSQNVSKDDQQSPATGASSASLALAAVGVALAVVSLKKNDRKE